MSQPIEMRSKETIDLIVDVPVLSHPVHETWHYFCHYLLPNSCALNCV